MERVREIAEDAAEERMLDALLPAARGGADAEPPGGLRHAAAFSKNAA